MAKLRCGRLQSYILLMLLFVTSLLLHASRPAQAQTPDDALVEQIWRSMTSEERVGQLFMVSFRGDEIDAELAALIQEYRIGGVVLSARRENFTNGPNTRDQLLALTNGLQTLARQAPSQKGQVIGGTVVTSTATHPSPSDYTPLPLFIALSHEGDGFPYTQIRSGLTPIPNQMAIGATWETENAYEVGQAVGHELSLLGVNMLLGPSLDVLDNPRPEKSGSLGTRSFGGHPYWVAEMGQAYIRGVHVGSQGQTLTIAKHFPGSGSSDREINQGVPTILKSLEALRKTELLPFFRVTQLDMDEEGVTDGLMTAHVRYQGLQGNISISLDARNLPALLALKEIAPWRAAGGLIVSAPLGSPAAWEGISVSGQAFPARRLAQETFLAGSDLILLEEFAALPDPAAELANIKDAIHFFQEKYGTDPNFELSVNRTVRRIIQAKIKIYGPDLLAAETERAPEELASLQEVSLELDQMAQAGVTLVSPSRQAGLTEPPRPDENILIFTDDRRAQDCPTCPEFALIETDALQKIILQLFGPDGTGQIAPEQITSLSFADLKDALLDTPTALERAAATQARLQNADWIIFVMLDIDPTKYPASDAVKGLLRKQFDTLRNKKLVLFAFNAPYFMDETEIGQLTAYYVFYSKGQAYLGAAARLLFQQFQPSGASPVAIPAIGPLDLNPDPTQVIQLEPVHRVDLEGTIIPIASAQPTLTTLDLKVGEAILFRTGVIMDKNGHPVPDGTLVDFFRYYPQENLPLEPLTTPTHNGVAEMQIVKERDTPLQVRASSNLAAQAVIFNIGPGIVETPTPTPTLTPAATETPTPTLTPVLNPAAELTATLTVPLPTPSMPFDPVESSKPISFANLAYSLLGMVAIGGLGFTLGGDRFSLEERVRPALVAMAAGLFGYIGHILLAVWNPTGSHWGAPIISIACAVLGVVVWYLKPGRIFWLKPAALPKNAGENNRQGEQS